MTPSQGRIILLGALTLVGRFWALLVLGALVALVAFVFAPRGMTEAMLVCAIVGAAMAVAAISAD